MEENLLKNDGISSEAVYIVVNFKELEALLNFHLTIPIPQAPTTF